MKAVILLSGGLDSTVTLALALQDQKECYALCFDYNQRHRVELQSAEKIAQYYQIPLQKVTLDLSPFSASSSLLGMKAIPQDRTRSKIAQSGIPSTYVPARNTLFLAYATGYAEILEADEIHYGANALDISGYPDCRPAYFEAYQQLLNLSTKRGVEGKTTQLITPVSNLNKSQIIQLGMQLNIPFAMTWSCYAPTEQLTPCERCDACQLRKEGFETWKIS